MSVNAGFKRSFVLAVFMHGCIFLFAFSFFTPEVSSRPAFVFLGSFLRQQDVMPSLVQSDTHANFDIRELNLDSRQGYWPVQAGKPSLVQKAAPQVKNQFKPKVAEAITPPKPKKSDASDLGIELEPLPPVKLKINRND